MASAPTPFASPPAFTRFAAAFVSDVTLSASLGVGRMRGGLSARFMVPAARLISASFSSCCSGMKLLIVITCDTWGKAASRVAIAVRPVERRRR